MTVIAREIANNVTLNDFLVNGLRVSIMMQHQLQLILAPTHSRGGSRPPHPLLRQ